MGPSVATPYNRAMAKNTAPKVARFEMMLSEEADAILRDLARRLGVSKASVVEMALRKLAQAEGADARPKEGE